MAFGRKPVITSTDIRIPNAVVAKDASRHATALQRPSSIIGFLLLALFAVADVLVIAGMTLTNSYAWRLPLTFGSNAQSQLWWPAWILLIAVFALIGLYREPSPHSGMALGTVEELRRGTYAILGVFGCQYVLTMSAHGFQARFFAMVVCSCGSTIFLLPVLRALLRSSLSRIGLWGMPVVVMGEHKSVAKVIHSLRLHPEFGLRAAAVLTDDPVPKELSPFGLPVLGGVAKANDVAKSERIRYGILALPPDGFEDLDTKLDQLAGAFDHLLVVPDREQFSTIWVTAQDVSGMLGLEVRQQLVLPRQRRVKSAIDLCLTLLLLIPLLPIIGIIALLIKLTSRGPVFYSAERLGQDSKPFRQWKFRTMYEDADDALERHLEEDPHLMEEWKRTFKLKTDPRVTWIGRILRRTSLDELPQLWNILRGDMSLVGPRPIVQQEAKCYGEAYDLFKRVKPGLSGLWQVSGRNDTSYEERVHLDCYYIRNWSPWLDVYILAQTVKAVITGAGAY